MKAYLCLQDGQIFAGKAIGACGEAVGEVVYYTGMTGYQEVITDPSSTGQIIVFTYPLIGNCGVNSADVQSAKAKAKGIVIKELSPNPSNYRAEQNLHNYLVSQGIVGITDIDTRALTKHLRDYGTMRGLISTDANFQELAKRARELPAGEGTDLVRSVTTQEVQVLPGGTYPIVVMDLGTKQSLLTVLRKKDCQVTLVGAGTGLAEILNYHPLGVVLSNGPGNPDDLEDTLPVIRGLLERNIPVFGVGLGHLLLGKALGGKTARLKTGHRGNYPVKDLRTGRIYQTSQNHGYVLQEENLPSDQAEIFLRNLHDQTVEGIRHIATGSFSVQFNPEGCPGPREAECFLDEFVEMVRVKQQGGRKDA